MRVCQRSYSQVSWRIALVLLMTSLLLASCSSREDETTAPGPSEGVGTQDGKALVRTRCTVCHSTDRIHRATFDRAGWERTVDRMIRTGARLDDAEHAAVLDYLASR